MRPYIILLLVVVLVGCQARLVPLSYKPSNPDGPVAIASQDEITVYLENLEYKSDLIVFDLEIVNNTETGFFFDPSKVHFYSSDNQLKQIDTSAEDWQESSVMGSSKPRYIMNQRKVENYYRQSIREKETGKFLVGLLAIGVIAMDVAGGGGEISTGSAFTDVAREVLVGATIVGSEVAQEVITNKQIQDDEDLYYLPDEYLVAQNIESEGAVRGKIFFRRSNSDTHYRVVVPVDYYDFIFDMREAKSSERQSLRVAGY
jgi:hypothetical protein